MRIDAHTCPDRKIRNSPRMLPVPRACAAVAGMRRTMPTSAMTPMMEITQNVDRQPAA